ncbi:MAG: urease accessory protein UreD [Rubrivivax sp.]
MSAASTGAGWRGHLGLRYWRDGPRTVALDRHEGPLRVLQRLYPEGEGICHHVLVHPPGGVAGGDVLELQADLARDTHAVLTTPGATRFYRSGGRPALQRSRLRLAPGARLEWLPLENLAFSGCEAENRTEIELAPGAEMIGWDLLALGLPASGADFETGCFTQHLALRVIRPNRDNPAAAQAHFPGGDPVWLERGRIDARDARLLDAAVGWAGRRVLGTAWWAAGQPLDAARREALLEAARACPEEPGLAGWTGITSPLAQVLVARALGDRVEPVMQWLNAVRAAWRQAAWGLQPHPPRVWRT